MASAPPTIFSPARRLAARQRMQQGADPARFVIDDIVADMVERLAFLRHEPQRALVIGDCTGGLARGLGAEVVQAEPGEGFNEELPFPFADFDLIASVATLDTVNDLPGALIHIRNALAAGGRAYRVLDELNTQPAVRYLKLVRHDRPAGAGEERRIG